MPVSFRGATYNIPLIIWVPYQYPSLPPTVLVIPGKNMGIRQTNHVDASGRCYHPYLAYWSQNPDKSSLLVLCSELKLVFSKEPPLYSKQQQPVQQAPASASETPPPPLPPLPQEIEAQRERTHLAPQPQTAPTKSSSPPPPPPKSELQHPSPAAYAYTIAPHLYDPSSQTRPQPVVSPQTPVPHTQLHAPPERPALPQKVPLQESMPLGVANSAYHHLLSNQPPHPHPVPVPAVSSPKIDPAVPPTYPQSPPPPIIPRYQQPPPPPPPPGNSQPHWPTQPAPHHHRLSGQYDVPTNRLPPAQSTSPRPLSFHGYPTHQSHIGPSKLGPHPPAQLKPKPQFNFLDDDSGMLPISVQSATPPPLPPNPEKDRLINEISKILQQKAEAASTKTMGSLEQTASQAEAMAKTEAYMERERIELIRINDICEKDQRILNERIAMADELIRDVRDREAPNIDAVVVAPTVVHNQLYELVTDDMAIEDTIYVLGKALDKERISLDVFLKHTRALAREQFMKRALVKKISKQIGMA
ncbi:hypothetical protein ABW19_dt0208091 [Dactylella cylindrospora]|nr:hypothetical protein ABW19_dt0208091 [Dactylella cylindrospora]